VQLHVVEVALEVGHDPTGMQSVGGDAVGGPLLGDGDHEQHRGLLVGRRADDHEPGTLRGGERLAQAQRQGGVAEMALPELTRDVTLRKIA